MRTGLTGGYVLKVAMYYMRAYLAGEHILQEYM